MSSHTSRSARAPVEPVPTPNAATLGPITTPGRATVNASTLHGSAGTRPGKSNRTFGFVPMASRRKRQRSAARSPVAHTSLMRNAGLRANSHTSRPQTCTLLPWSRGNSISARGCSVKNACNSRWTAA